MTPDPCLDSSLDPLSEVLNRLQIRAQGLARLLVLGGEWGIEVPAARAEFAMYAVRQGRCRLVREGCEEPVMLETGDSALILKSCPHQVDDGSGTVRRPLGYWLEQRAAGCAIAPHSPGAEGATLLISETFSFAGPLAGAVASALGGFVHLRAGESDGNPRQQHLFGMLCLEATNLRPGTAFVYSRLMELFFVEFLRTAVGCGACVSDGNLLRVLFDPQLVRAVEEVHRHPEWPWTVAALARTAAMSRTAFAVRFARVAGVTPLTYVTQWRMAVAEELLREGHTLGEVAQRVGYDSEAAFSRAFKRQAGVAPGAVRRGERTRGRTGALL